MSHLPATYRALAEQFGEQEEIPDVPSLDAVRRFAAGHVARLLDQNPTLLMSILYRVDVAEQKVRGVFRYTGHDAIPNELADLMIARQIEKLEARRRYGTNRRSASDVRT